MTLATNWTPHFQFFPFLLIPSCSLLTGNHSKTNTLDTPSLLEKSTFIALLRIIFDRYMYKYIYYLFKIEKSWFLAGIQYGALILSNFISNAYPTHHISLSPARNICQSWTHFMVFTRSMKAAHKRNGLPQWIPESPMDSLHICISIHNPCVWLCSVVCSSLQPHELQHTRFLCPWDFPQQEYWNGLLLPPPGDLLDPRIQNKSPESPALAGGFFTTEPLGKPMVPIRAWNFHSICKRLMLLPWSYGILWPADKQSYQ